MDTETEAPPIGHNNPPEPTPFEAAREMISSLDVEAQAWFDGAPIENEQQAADVARILDAARKAKQQADAERKAEKEPHAQAAKAVDEKWKPLLADADRIADCAKKAQTKWLLKLEAVKRAEEEQARREAAAAEEEARRLAAAAAETGSLEDAKARDAAIKDSQQAARAAAHAATEKPRAKGEGMSRAVGLRTVYRAQVDDRRALLNHIASRDPQALIDFVNDWAGKQVRSGARVIPGVTVIEERVAA
jgi:hypothetical protein